MKSAPHIGIQAASTLLTIPRVQKALFVIEAGVHIAYMLLSLLGVSIPWIGSYGVVEPEDAYIATETEAVDADERFLLHDPESDTWFRLDGDEMWNESDGEYMNLDFLSESSYWGEVKERLDSFISGREEAWFILPTAIALFLLGIFMMRGGLFEPRGATMRYTLIAIGATALVWDMAGSISVAFTVPGSFGRYGLPVLISWGLMAGVAQFYINRSESWLGSRLKDVGRLALSCYVGQSILCTMLFSSYALNAGRFIPDSWGIWKVVAAWLFVSTLLIAVAAFWRRHFDRGPLEGLWNWGYKKLMRITPGWGKPREIPVAAAAAD